MIGYEEEGFKAPDDEEGEVLVTTGDRGTKILEDKRGNVLKRFTCGGNCYANQCDQKKENEEKKTKKDAHLHLTASKVTSPYFDNTNVNNDFGEWGSVILD
eukprot:6877299-Ditylum_brightwellii.AAC.1